MKSLKKILKWGWYVLLIPSTYITVAVILTSITIDRKIDSTIADKHIFLSTNGVHLDIVIPKGYLDPVFLSGLKHNESDRYLSFGWGDENFYINTPTWGDLTFPNAFTALFLKSTTLIHVTRYNHKRSDWIEIKVSASELQNLIVYLNETFKKTENGSNVLLKNKGYTSRDDFYKSKGSYSCFKTCNSWVNSGFKESGLKSCLWTPFDFGLMRKYEY